MSNTQRPSVLEMSLWSLTWPILIELCFSFTLGLEDSFYLSKISDQAAGAVGSLLPILGVCNVVFQTFAISGASVASQLIGGGRDERVNRTFVTMILLNGAFGSAVALFFLAFHRKVGALLGLSPNVDALATEFLRLVGPILLLQALRFAYASIINARGRTRINMMGAIFVNVANVSLNHMLTQGTFGLPKLGVTGVACSTIVAQSLGLMVSSTAVHVFLGVRWKMEGYWKELKATVSPILGIALPSVVEPISFQLNQLVLVGIVVSLGDVALATRTYTLNLIVFAIVWSFSLGLGTQIKIAHLIGARRFDEANVQLHKSLRLGMICGVVMMAVLSTAARPIYGLFTDDPEILRLGRKLMLLGLVMEPCRSSNMICGGSLRGSGDARFVSLVSVLLTWGIAVPVAYVLALRLHLGIVGVWLGMICDELARGLMNFRRWQTGIWRTKGVLTREAA